MSQHPSDRTTKKTDGDTYFVHIRGGVAAATTEITSSSTTTTTSGSISNRRPATELLSIRRETDPLLPTHQPSQQQQEHQTTSAGRVGFTASTLRSRRSSSKSPVLLSGIAASMLSSTNKNATTNNNNDGDDVDVGESSSEVNRYDESLIPPSHGSYQAIEDNDDDEHDGTSTSSKTSAAAAAAGVGAVVTTKATNATRSPWYHQRPSTDTVAQSLVPLANTGASASVVVKPVDDILDIPIGAEQSHQQSHSRGSLSSSSASSSHRRRTLQPPLPAGRGSRGGSSSGGTGIPHHPHHQNSSHDDATTASHSSQSPPPILEIPEEIYTVRKAALQVLKPLTKTWVVISVGFALTVLFGTARWTRLMPGLPFWFILLPCWLSHIGLLWLHVLSAQALSNFIAEANESRQRPDSRDHLNRTEYLPLLQRSLKFGLKTGLLSFCVFVFEILIYVRMAKGTISLTATFIPLWLLISGGILDGLICKTQHFLRVLCWVLAFTAMVLVVLKVDYNCDNIRWRVVISPVVAILSIASATLIYIVYGHQVGYYRLTESQLTAGNLYSLAALICMVLMVMIGEVIPLSRPVEIETRLFVVILAPLVICLVGMGAWVVSRDEFARLLLYGGQSAVHPMKLKWEAKGWTCVQGKGVVIIPMFGEVSFQPLERKPTERVVELLCCQGSCYPYEEDDEETVHLTENDTAYHPYLDPLHSRNAPQIYRGM